MTQFSKDTQLTADTFIGYAMHYYDNPQCCSVLEFRTDLLRFRSINRLIKNKEEGGEFKYNLLLNHLTILFNIFGDGAVNMLYFKVYPKYWSVLYTFLIYLNKMPDSLHQYGIGPGSIEADPDTLTALREFDVRSCK